MALDGVIHHRKTRRLALLLKIDECLAMGPRLAPGRTAEALQRMRAHHRTQQRPVLAVPPDGCTRERCLT